MMRRPLKSKRPARQQIDDGTSFLAPVGGWNTMDPEAAMRPEFALQLDNWWPTPANVKIRQGASVHKTGFAAPVKTLMGYNPKSGTGKLFASTDAGIYDATTAGAVGAASATHTLGKCQYVNFSASGANYLFVVNGQDSLQHYNGSTWANVATYPLTGGGNINTTEFIGVNVFKRRLFFIRKATLDFVYLDVDSIGGNATVFPLGGLFSSGGYLVAMGTWTVDGGQGVDDYAAFVTSEGQVAIYKGINPSDPTAWALQGIYDLAAPLGYKCFLKFGGDLLYLSRSGLYPLGKALQSSTVNLKTAVSNRIGPTFTASATSFGANYGWQAVMYLASDMLLVNVPVAEFSQSVQYVMNTISGAWARFTDWDAFCFEVFESKLFMGMASSVSRAFYGTDDFGANIACYAKGAFNYFGGRGIQKSIQLLRPVLKINGTTSVSVAVDMDFNNGTAYGPTVFNTQSGSIWGASLWGPAIGAGVWSGIATVKLDWITVATPPGYAAAVRLRVLGKGATVEWSATDVVFERGNIQG